MSEQEPETHTDAERVASLQARVAELEGTMRAAAIKAELRTEAVRAGMIDLDCLKLMDGSGLEVDGTGIVTGAAELVAGLKREKPWLFANGNSSSPTPVPPNQPARARLATEMSYAEWQAARREMLRRR